MQIEAKMFIREKLYCSILWSPMKSLADLKKNVELRGKFELTVFKLTMSDLYKA